MFHLFGFWARTWYHSSGHAEVASHTAQSEELTSRIYNYVLGGSGEKKKKEWQQMLDQVPILKKITIIIIIISGSAWWRSS